MKDPRARALIRNFIIELAIYAALVVVYFLLVLRYLADPLQQLFDSNLFLYAIVCLLLIVAQAVVLESITSFIINQVGLDKLD
ncbi:hypothetical protein ACFLT5_02690 [Chloroflexota bacterium]